MKHMVQKLHTMETSQFHANIIKLNKLITILSGSNGYKKTK